MTAPLVTSLIDELNETLGDRPFFTTRDLHDLGFFGTLESARLALKDGRLAYIEISPRRRLITRAALLEYLLKNYSEHS